MRIQFSTTQNYSSPILANGLSFEGVPSGGGGTKIDPPDNTNPTPLPPPTEPVPEEEEESTVEADAS